MQNEKRELKKTGIGNSTTTLFVKIRSKIARPGQNPCVEHGLAPIGRPSGLPHAGLNPRYGIAAQTDLVGHQNNTLAMTTSHLAFLYGNYPFRGKYQGLVTPQRLYLSKYGHNCCCCLNSLSTKNACCSHFLLVGRSNSPVLLKKTGW